MEAVLDFQYPVASLDFPPAKHHVFATQQAKANAERGGPGVPVLDHQAHRQELEQEPVQLDLHALQAKLSHAGSVQQA